MKKHRYIIGIDGSGVDELIKGIEEYKAWLKSRTQVLLQRLADEGFQVTAAGFQQAQYDGTNDSTVTLEDRGENVKAVVALGSAVLFIEFGTGVTYPDNHPEAADNGMVRGAYGQGKGRQKAWAYYGETGTNGVVVRDSSKGQVVLTHGNPANMPMYAAVKQLKELLPKLVKEVFSSD